MITSPKNNSIMSQYSNQDDDQSYISKEDINISKTSFIQ